ncbi:MAG TPA: glutamine synthetase family protein [Woeseiaceae bacterium]|jgi:glutamine synthetase|nr:glutamine synthetase family protein [Woeseiaceae bacterium]
MAQSNRKPLLAELRQLLRKEPDTATMELLVPDISGVLRSKRIRRQSFEKTCDAGFWFPRGAILMNAIGDFVPGMIGESDGDPDTLCALVPGSIVPVPWLGRPSAQALFRILEPDGEPFFADPRAVLERAVQPLCNMNLKIVMATELEFYLLDAHSDTPSPLPNPVPGIGRPQIGPQVYHPDDLLEVEHFLNDLYAYCEAQGIPADTATSEFAPGQFEINLVHVDDPVLACDHAVLLKRAVKATARKHGYVACFMAKPFADDAGNGLHIHMSLVDRNGRNYFSHGRESLASPPFSARLRHAVGGLLKTMPEATALFAPNANSYRRLRPEIFAPVDPNWGVNHRSVAVRIPQADQKNLRFEHRVAGADANPYLVTAAIAAGVHYGLKNKLDPGRMIKQGESVQLKTRIPDRWDYALDKLARGKVLAEYLGKDFVDCYVEHRRGESRQFRKQVNPLDFDWYLRAL